MRSLLDSIIDAQSAGPRIVSEQHDTNKIDYGGSAAVDRALSGGRPQGPWDEAEYGISLAEAQRRWDAARTPEERAKVAEELKQRAIRRAGLDTTGGRVAVMVAGKDAWHKLGVNIAEATDSKNALALSGTGFTVGKLPLGYQWGDKFKDSGEAWAIVREDTGDCLGVVGGRYAPIQNAEAFAFMDTVLAEFGAKYETAGSLYGGRKVWLQATLPAQAFEVVRGDRVEGRATFVNVHDGSGCALVYPTADRIECGNTCRTVTAEALARALKIRHTGSVRDKLDDARRTLGVAVKGIETFKEEAEVMARTPCPDHRGYFSGVLDEVLEITQAKVKMGAAGLANADILANALNAAEHRDRLERHYQRLIDGRAGILDDILNRYEQQRCGIAGIRGTAWGAFNAVTEHADHFRGGRKVGTQEDRDSRHLESILSGDRDEMKQAARSAALALAN